jgi:hypothetical protein
VEVSSGCIAGFVPKCCHVISIAVTHVVSLVAQPLTVGQKVDGSNLDHIPA